MEGDMSDVTGRPRGPDLSALRIDEHARRDPKRLTWRPIGAGLALLLVVSAVLWFVLREKAPEIEVTTVRADKGGRPALLNASGYVTPRQRATIAAKITARVNEIYVDEGMRVEPGQILAKLDDSDARARLLSTLAERDATAATLGDLRVNLDNCIVRAPFGGIVVSKDAQRGEMVSPVSAGGGFTRTGIATIVDMGSLEIEVDVNESYIARVKPGQQVTAVLDAYPDWQIPAKVRTVIPTADRQKATGKVRATFDRLDPRILPDMGVKVTFLGEERSVPVEAAGRLLLPPAGLVEAGRTTARL